MTLSQAFTATGNSSAVLFLLPSQLSYNFTSCFELQHILTIEGNHHTLTFAASLVIVPGASLQLRNATIQIETEELEQLFWVEGSLLLQDCVLSQLPSTAISLHGGSVVLNACVGE